MAKLFLMLAALNGFLAVGLGAFAAHGLKSRLSADLLAVFQTGVQYHMYHALALLGAGLLAIHYPTSVFVRVSGFAFVAGILLFSGSLYVLSLTGVRWLGAITPLGGLAFLLGWGMFGWAVYKANFPS